MRGLNFLKRFLCEEDGPTAVEYAAMLALIVITCLAGMRSVGNNMVTKFETIADAASGAPTYPVGATSAGYTNVPPVGKWSMALGGGTNIVLDVVTGVETTYWGGGGTNTTTLPPGYLGSDRGQQWTRTE